jgi:hypothetical protein
VSLPEYFFIAKTSYVAQKEFAGNLSQPAGTSFPLLATRGLLSLMHQRKNALPDQHLNSGRKFFFRWYVDCSSSPAGPWMNKKIVKR